MTDNLRHWDELSKTDPTFTKAFTRGGGFRGTDINPTWRIKRMTERFGPVGIGWGMTEPHFDMVQEDAGRVVYCRVGIWYRDGDQKSEIIWGVGGDVVSGKRANGQAFVDDEAQKKAYTDALGNAMKAIGVSADVFLKQFDDSKYREEVGREFAEKRQEAKPSANRPQTKSEQAKPPAEPITLFLAEGEVQEFPRTGKGALAYFHALDEAVHRDRFFWKQNAPTAETLGEKLKDNPDIVNMLTAIKHTVGADRKAA